MRIRHEFAVALCALAAMLLNGGTAVAQSTDGYHGIQVFPVVVDSTTFSQRFTFDNPNNGPVHIWPQFFPGSGTAQAAVGAINCLDIEVPAHGMKVFSSLRELCPGLVSGSAFGFLYTIETDPQNRPYAGYSRVSNFAGAGFSVEAFPAHTFISSEARVTGLRRLAATGSSPAYQTNCFIASLNDLQPAGTRTAVTVGFVLHDAANNAIGSGSQAVMPGQLVRILDIFNAAGAAPGDHDDARITFYNASGGSYQPGLMTFCTVQDNTSFGADFRIAKPAQRENGNAADWHVKRTVLGTSSIPSGTGFTRDMWLVHFRHPDFVQCQLLDASFAPINASYGLEMRMLAPVGGVVAGGNDVTAFGEVYLGDKADRDNGGNSTLWHIDVESSEVNTGVSRPYHLRCRSGSGSPDPIRIGSGQLDQF